MNIPTYTIPDADIPSWTVNKFYPHPQTKLAPCISNCPNHTDVRGWINIIAQRQQLGLSLEQALKNAWLHLIEFNPLPAVLGRICPHTCESQCNRQDKEAAVSIHLLERYLGDFAIAQNWEFPNVTAESQTTSIGVIGAGPAGLSFAYQMARLGYSVDVYEQYSGAGGMLRYSIPNYRLPVQILDAEIARFTTLGIKFHFNITVGKNISFATLQKRHAEIFIGIGAHQPRILGISGESDARIISGIEFIRRVKQGESFNLGSHVVIIGGGNTAIDAARIARRMGSTVTLLYRRTQQNMPANVNEVEEAMREGINFKFLSIVTEIHAAIDNLCLMVQTVQITNANSNITPASNAVQKIFANAVVIAISQHPNWNYLHELAFDTEFLPATATGQIKPGIWAGGDVLRMGTVVQAISDGRSAAINLNAKLHGKQEPAIFATPSIHSDNLRLEHYADRQQTQENIRPQESWLVEPDKEIHLGLTQEQFLTEISRCLSCGSCYGCKYCWMYCNVKAYTFRTDPAPGAYFEFALQQCEGCGKCVELCPTGFLRD